MKNKTLMDLRRCCNSLRDSTGKDRDKPIDIIESANTNSVNIMILRDIIDIIMTSKKINIDTKLFITTECSCVDINTYVNSYHSEQGNKQISYLTTINNLSRDNEILDKILSDKIRLLIYNNIEDYDTIDKMLITLRNELNIEKNIRKNLLINIDSKYCNNKYKNETSEFFEILSSLENYLSVRKDIIEQAVNSDKKFIGYFNYLLSKKDITDKQELIDKERLIKFLSNEDYTTGYNEEEEGYIV